jgi:hypothetical protein
MTAVQAPDVIEKALAASLGKASSMRANSRCRANAVERVLAKELREQAYFGKQPSPGDQRGLFRSISSITRRHGAT